MMLLELIPLAASVLLALGCGSLSRRLPPWLAAPLLTLLALATSLATGVVLCLAAFSALARQPLVAAAGGWSRATLRPLSQLPPGWGLLAAVAAGVLLTAALVFAVRAMRDLVAASRACRKLDAGHQKLVITRDDRPTAYSLPARTGTVVVSTGMLRLLSADERRALLAHEDAHLRHHHVGYVLLAELAAAANPLLRPLARHVRLAVELWADESAAAEVGDRRLVARALARASLAASAAGGRPGVRLAIAETDVGARVRALVDQPRRLHPWAAAAALALILASSAAAVTLTWATHQRIEVAQLASVQAQARAARY
jgi:beta-lactamase regulating signal transducer with metallopeptidase domain